MLCLHRPFKGGMDWPNKIQDNFCYIAKHFPVLTLTTDLKSVVRLAGKRVCKQIELNASLQSLCSGALSWFV